MAVTTIARRVLATGAIAGTALLALTIPASAHTPKLSAKCDIDTGKTTLHVNLENYNGQKDNTVKAVEGSNALVDTTFKSNFSKDWDFSATEAHTFTVSVVAWDDEDGKQGFTFTQTLTVEACVTPPPVTTTTTTVAPTTTTSSEAPAPSTKPAPPKDQGGLANTGASVGLPLGIGALLLVGGGALLLVVRKRRSAA